MNKINKPAPAEYAHFYSGYISEVGDENILAFLKKQSKEFVEYIKQIPDEKLLYKYEAGKWSVAEVLGHIIDTERVMAYRALRFARGDKAILSGYDQDEYVAAGRFDERSLSSLVAEFEGLRVSNLEFAQTLNEEESVRTGEANGAVFSVRALLYVMAGHLQHHWDILQQRYLD
ncbi:DinB family protein [Marinoscillum furvescens]|uniref:DinB family protein n=1 Tax=Marinoscillum furvescens DSM 4134 TaxID=1122208 RepID=A0A3D9L6Z9_MARFU|nr:DinB family protein [Marinoscillum furvescens]REE02129.1 DinB family protein [Marinoscillum furvescens DSM 4134]